MKTINMNNKDTYRLQLYYSDREPRNNTLYMFCLLTQEKVLTLCFFPILKENENELFIEEDDWSPRTCYKKSMLNEWETIDNEFEIFCFIDENQFTKARDEKIKEYSSNISQGKNFKDIFRDIPVFLGIR